MANAIVLTKWIGDGTISHGIDNSFRPQFLDDYGSQINNFIDIAGQDISTIPQLINLYLIKIDCTQVVLNTIMNDPAYNNRVIPFSVLNNQLTANQLNNVTNFLINTLGIDSQLVNRYIISGIDFITLGKYLLKYCKLLTKNSAPDVNINLDISDINIS